jgi:phenylacetate-CoA ligase
MYLSLLLALIKVYTLPYLPARWQRQLTERRVIMSVRDAYYNVPFYRRKYDNAGININHIRRLEDMKLLPLLTKEEIRLNFPGDMVRRGTNIDKCHRESTSGSTGQPLSFIISPTGYAYYLAESARIYSMIGYRPWHRSCYLRSKPLNLTKISASRQTFISTSLPVSEQIAQLKKLKPHLIDAHPCSLLEIASNISKEELRFIKPRAITVNSEMSTIEERDYLSGVFNCPVYDEYGSYEFWSIATQCKKHKYHISSDSIWMEFLDSNAQDVPANEIGNIVITSTRSKVMPFIRYLIGDAGCPSDESCSCGYNSPLMQSFEGRADDWLVLPSGKVIPPSKILGLCGITAREHPMLFDHYKIVQRQRDLLIFQYIRGKEFSVALLDNLLKNLAKLFDEPVTILSEEKLSHPEGKRQIFQSLVSHNDLI